jgi:predicted nuclease of predicted toxin-antitoxin system
MRFLVDECTGPLVADWLRSQSHDVLSIYDEAPGLRDDEVLAKALADARILITNDKDFGEMVYREGKPHLGVIFLRLQDERAASKVSAIRRLLDTYAERIPGSFVVVTETQIRFAGFPSKPK